MDGMPLRYGRAAPYPAVPSGMPLRMRLGMPLNPKVYALDKQNLVTKEHCLSKHLYPEPLPSFERIKLWIEECSTKHGNNCKPFNIALADESLWLVDLRNECIASAAMGTISYVALSYVWGEPGHQVFTALKSNLESLQQPGGLAPYLDPDYPPTGAKIPHTVRDAIDIAKVLGFRFLWVDTLCIIQDDEMHLETQLKHMGAIYSGAELTIVATQGNSCGRGIHFVSFSKSNLEGQQTRHVHTFRLPVWC